MQEYSNGQCIVIITLSFTLPLKKSILRHIKPKLREVVGNHCLLPPAFIGLTFQVFTRRCFTEIISREVKRNSSPELPGKIVQLPSTVTLRKNLPRPAA